MDAAQTIEAFEPMRLSLLLHRALPFKTARDASRGLVGRWIERQACDRASPRGAGSLKGLALAVVFVAGLPAVAAAQSSSFFDTSGVVGVLDRPRPDYQAVGITEGAFKIFPSLTVTPEYDDNIYASTNQKQSDLVTAISPAVQIHSNWSRHEIDAFATATSDIYASHSGEDTTDFQIGGSGRLDILSQSNVSANFSYGHNTQPRTADNTISSTSSPVQYDQTSAAVSALQTLNRLKFTEGLNFQHTSYGNTTDFSGNFLPLQYLDNSAYTLSGRADYALSPQFALLVSAQLNDRPYDSTHVATQIDRSSTGYETTVGADFEITRLIRGEVQLGYLAQNYTSSAFHQVSGPAVHASVKYVLSGLTTLTFGLDRRVIDAVDPTAVSFLQSQTTFQVDHELLRNVILSGRLGYETDDYRGVQRNDSRPSASFSTTYLLNHRVGLTAAYSFLDQESAGAARIGRYAVNLVSLSLVFQL